MGVELIYFDIHGRGFMPRLVLAAAGIKFTDTRVTFAQLAEMKKSKARFKITGPKYDLI